MHSKLHFKRQRECSQDACHWDDIQWERETHACTRTRASAHTQYVLCRALKMLSLSLSLSTHTHTCMHHGALILHNSQRSRTPLWVSKQLKRERERERESYRARVFLSGNKNTWTIYLTLHETCYQSQFQLVLKLYNTYYNMIYMNIDIWGCQEVRSIKTCINIYKKRWTGMVRFAFQYIYYIIPKDNSILFTC
jgi:hypothetical protein